MDKNKFNENLISELKDTCDDCFLKDLLVKLFEATINSEEGLKNEDIDFAFDMIIK